MVKFLCNVILLTTIIFVASSNASSIEIPETDITMFNTEHDYKFDSDFAEPEPNTKNDNDSEDLDPLDKEELQIPSKPIRVKRVVAFRPLFVYRQEQAKHRLIAADRRRARVPPRRRGSRQGQRPTLGTEHTHQLQHGY